MTCIEMSGRQDKAKLSLHFTQFNEPTINCAALNPWHTNEAAVLGARATAWVDACLLCM